MNNEDLGGMSMKEDEKCPECCGWGEIVYDDIFGYSQAAECKACNGTGKKLPEKMNTD